MHQTIHPQFDSSADASVASASDLDRRFVERVNDFERSHMTAADGLLNLTILVQSDLLRTMEQLQDEAEDELRQACEIPLLTKRSAVGRYVRTLDTVLQICR
jgi:hypothetical protein